MAQQWQCHHLLDAAAGGSGRSSTNAAAAAHSVATLDKACHLLGAIACPSTPFRYYFLPGCGTCCICLQLTLACHIVVTLEDCNNMAQKVSSTATPECNTQYCNASGARYLTRAHDQYCQDSVFGRHWCGGETCRRFGRSGRFLLLVYVNHTISCAGDASADLLSTLPLGVYRLADVMCCCGRACLFHCVPCNRPQVC